MGDAGRNGARRGSHATPWRGTRLFEPADGGEGRDFGMHGIFGDRTISWDPQLWASRHHGTIAAAASALLAGLVARRAGRR